MALYQPKFNNASWADKQSDKWLGTNRVEQVDFANQLEQSKYNASLQYELQNQLATNNFQMSQQSAKNEYQMLEQWNKDKYQINIDGMKQAGINPMLMTGNLANSASAPTMTSPNQQGSYQGVGAPSINPNFGGVSDLFNDLIQMSIDSLNPRKLKDEIKGIISSII